MRRRRQKPRVPFLVIISTITDGVAPLHTRGKTVDVRLVKNAFDLTKLITAIEKLLESPRAFKARSQDHGGTVGCKEMGIASSAEERN